MSGMKDKVVVITGASGGIGAALAELLARRGASHFKSRGEGHVINISSMLGRIPMALMRSAYSASKHFLNALTANFRTEVQETHPGIQFSVVSPGIVRTDFGNNARHGGPDSRSFPEPQSAEEVAEVIAGVIESRKPDVYTRSGAQAWVAKTYAEIGVDP
ncbi:hypothetical protein BH11GEM2_BH11GEM2_23170 [soil metagenome]